MSTILGCKDIGIRNSEFVTKTQFLFTVFLYKLVHFQIFLNFTVLTFFNILKVNQIHKQNIQTKGQTNSQAKYIYVEENHFCTL